MSAYIVDDGKFVAKKLFLISFAGAAIRLIKAAITPAANHHLADILAIHADYNGYVEQGTTVEAHGLNTAAGYAWIRFAPKTFTKVAGGVSNTIYGYALSIATPTPLEEWLYSIQLYEPQLPMIDAGDEITVHPEIRFLLQY